MNILISDFLKNQTTLTICCVDEEDNPWCFSCFYAFNSIQGLLYYKSSDSARHSSIINKNPVIAGAVLPDRLNKLMVRGVQLSGVVLPVESELCKDATRIYYASHPLAITMQGRIWTIQINHLKFTDTSIGFAKKLSWKRAENQPQ